MATLRPSLLAMARITKQRSYPLSRSLLARSMSTEPKPYTTRVPRENTGEKQHAELWGSILSNLEKSSLPDWEIKKDSSTLDSQSRNQLASERWAQSSKDWMIQNAPKGIAETPTVFTGRTVALQQTRRRTYSDLSTTLNTLVRRNRVKAEMMRDKFFVKPFEQRYRLRSIRWRKRFAAMVREKVQIVQAIRRRGM